MLVTSDIDQSTHILEERRIYQTICFDLANHLILMCISSVISNEERDPRIITYLLFSFLRLRPLLNISPFIWVLMYKIIFFLLF